MRSGAGPLRFQQHPLRRPRHSRRTPVSRGTCGGSRGSSPVRRSLQERRAPRRREGAPCQRIPVLVADGPTVAIQLRLDGVEKHQRPITLNDERIRRERCGVLRQELALLVLDDFLRLAALAARGFRDGLALRPDARPRSEEPRPPKSQGPVTEVFAEASVSGASLRR